MTTTEGRLRDAFAAAAAAVPVPVADRAAVRARAVRRRRVGAVVALGSLVGAAAIVTATRPEPVPDGPRTYVALGRDGLVLVDARTDRPVRTLIPPENARGVRDFDVSPDGGRVLVELFLPRGGCIPLRLVDADTGADSVVPESHGASVSEFAGDEIAYAREACDRGAVVGSRQLRLGPGPGPVPGPGAGRPVLARSHPAQFLHPQADGSYAWHTAPDVEGCPSELGAVVPGGRLVATHCADRTSFLALIPDDPAAPARVLTRLPELVYTIDADQTGRHVLLGAGSWRLIRWDAGGEPRYLPLERGTRAAW